jgi:hypothetical protein
MRKYPRGKLNASDEGALDIQVRVKDHTVIVEFRKPVAWFGMDPKTAEAFINTLIDATREANRGIGDTICIIV